MFFGLLSLSGGRDMVSRRFFSFVFRIFYLGVVSVDLLITVKDIMSGRGVVRSIGG